MPADRPARTPQPGGPSPGGPAPETPAVFVDANVFLRYLTDDVPEQADAVEAFLERAAAGELRLVTSVLVLAEVVWTLGSFYKRSRTHIRDAVLAICHTPGLEVEDADGLVQAAEWHAEKNVDFADAYHAAWMRQRGIGEVRTFNLKHFQRFGTLHAARPE